MNQEQAKSKIRILVYIVLTIAVFLLPFFNVKEDNSYWDELKNTFSGLSVELLGVIVLFFIAQYFFIWEKDDDERNKKLDNFLAKIENEESSIVFKTKSDSRYNTEFYDFLNDKISNANNNVFITGEGFSATDEFSKKICDDYIKAHVDALERGVSIVRLQSVSYISDYWNDQLKFLLGKYDKFQLFLSNMPSGQGSICSIDSSSDKNNISEFMLSVPTLTGTKSLDLAGLAVFIEKDQQLATRIKDIILNQTNDRQKSQEISLNNFDLHMNDSYAYFAYGSNMLEERFINRCPSGRRIDSVAKVSNYKLVFNRKGDYSSGGVASIIPSHGNDVYGVVYLINKEDVKNLEEIENPTGESYYKRDIIVQMENGDFLTCLTYISYPQGNLKPTEEYLQFIINGAIKSNLPQSYIEVLKSIEKK